MDRSRLPRFRPPGLSGPPAWAYAGLFGLAVLRLLPSPAHAIGLEDLIRAGLAGNREYLAAREETSALAYDTLASATAVNPVLEVEAFHNASHPESPAASVKVSREFQPGLRRKTRETARAEWATRQVWNRSAELDLAAEIRSAYLDALLLERKAGQQREVIARWEGLAKIAAGQVAQGRLSEVDHAQARLNALKAGQEEMDLRSRRAASLGRLQVLAALPAPPDSLEPLALDSLPALPGPDSLSAWAASANPDLAALDAVIAAQKRRLEMEQAGSGTPIHLSAGYERSEDGAHLVGGGIGIPLQFRGRNQVAILKARAGLRSAELRRAAASHRLAADVAASHARLGSLAARLAHHRGEIRDLARRQMELSEKGFRQGLLGVFDLSRVQEEYLAREGEALGLLEEYHQEWIRLGRTAGGRTW
jgi:outer membrane protein TolC